MEGKKSELLLRLEAYLEATAQQRRLEAKGTGEQVGQTVRLVIHPNEMVGMMSPPVRTRPPPQRFRARSHGTYPPKRSLCRLVVPTTARRVE
jgi:hypothetical protein